MIGSGVLSSRYKIARQTKYKILPWVRMRTVPSQGSSDSDCANKWDSLLAFDPPGTSENDR